MQLCLALDLESLDENLALLRKLEPIKENLWIKVGLRSFIRDGIGLLHQIHSLGNFKIFLDLKLYDIPNTMADAAQECAALGVDMITIHTSSGAEAMHCVMERLKKFEQTEGSRPLVFGVTALTSFDEKGFEEIYHKPIQAQASLLGKMAYENQLDGIVCSVFESLEIKAESAPSFLTLTPGIRPFAESNDDQKRVATIAEAKKNQSDFLVIGRPIYKAQDPLSTTRRILEEMSRG